MSGEIMNDRTDHNRLAEQFAARLREASSEAPKKPHPIRRTAETAEVTIPVASAAAPEIISCEQNSPEWFRARMGIPTASAFGDVLAKGEGKTRRAYILKLAGEVLTGEPMENFSNANTDRGHLMEPDARDLYMFQTGAQLDRVGFIRRDRAGCSPDSLIGEDGGLEIKTTAPHLLIDLILKDEFPAIHKAQVQGTLWVTGRQWWDIAVYWPGLPLFVKRTQRDEVFIQNLAAEVDRFNAELDSVVAQMRQRIELSDALPFASAA